MTPKTKIDQLNSSSSSKEDSSDSDNWNIIDHSTLTENQIRAASMLLNQVDDQNESDSSFEDANSTDTTSDSENDEPLPEKIFEFSSKDLRNSINSKENGKSTSASSLNSKKNDKSTYASSSNSDLIKLLHCRNLATASLMEKQIDQVRAQHQSKPINLSTMKSGATIKLDEIRLTNDNANQMNKMNLDLKFKFRDKIIEHLNGLSGLLLSLEKVSNEAKIELTKQTNELVLILMNLPLISMRENKEKILNNDKQLKCLPKTRLNQIINKLVLELNRDKRMKLIQHLIDNRDFIISNTDLDKNKIDQLVNENNILIEMMIRLPANKIKIDDTDTQTIESQDQQSNEDETNKLRQFVEYPENSLMLMIKRAIKKFNDIHQYDINKSDETFIFEIENSNEFLSKGKRKDSRIFFCRSLQWCLSIQLNKYANSTDYLGIYLRSENHCIKNWKCQTRFVLQLIAQKSDKQDKIKSTGHEFSSETSRGFGFDKFISIDQLTTGGYLVNDCLKVKISLTAMEPSRDIHNH